MKPMTVNQDVKLTSIELGSGVFIARILTEDGQKTPKKFTMLK